MRLRITLMLALLLLSSLPAAGQMQGTVQATALQVQLEVSPIGSLLQNTTITFRGVNGSAFLTSTLIEYPPELLHLIPMRGGQPLLYSNTNPPNTNAAVRLDIAQSMARNRTVFILDPGPNLIVPANGTLTLSFWFYLGGGLSVTHPPSRNYTLDLFLPALSMGVERLEYGIAVPSGVSLAAGYRFESTTEAGGRTIYTNTTSVPLREPRHLQVKLLGSATAKIIPIHVPRFERRLLVTQAGELLINERILIENRGADTLESLPLTLLGGVTRFDILPPPPPYPGFRVGVKTVEGKLDLKNITRSIRPGQRAELTYQYPAPAQLFRVHPWGIQVALPAKPPLPIVAEVIQVSIQPFWGAGSIGQTFEVLSDYDRAVLDASIALPLAGGASIIVGAGLIGYWAIILGALLLPGLSPGTIIRRRIPQLQRVIGSRLEKDREFMAEVQRLLKNEITLQDLTRSTARLLEERETLLGEWADLKAALTGDEALPMERMGSVERAYEKAFSEAAAMVERLVKGAVGREAFERQWASMARRMERQGRELREVLQSLVERIEERSKGEG